MSRQLDGSKRCPSDIDLSKKLSWLLRHGAIKEGIKVQPDGFIDVNSILLHPRYAAHYSQTVLERLVLNDKKQRYMLRRNPATNVYEIRANQGHSMKNVESEQCLEEIKFADSIPMAVHGTYKRFWERIKMEGLSKMGRLHVHFATFDDGDISPNESSAKEISGFRRDCQILIYLNVPKILADGRMKLYRSANGVVLCAGLEATGTIPSEFFVKVVDRRTGRLISF